MVPTAHAGVETPAPRPKWRSLCRPIALLTGKFIPVPVHNLVLEVFVGPRPEGTVACHNNTTTAMVMTIASETSGGTRGRPTRRTRFAMECTAIRSQSCPMRRCSNFFFNPTRRAR